MDDLQRVHDAIAAKVLAACPAVSHIELYANPDYEDGPALSLAAVYTADGEQDDDACDTLMDDFEFGNLLGELTDLRGLSLERLDVAPTKTLTETS